MGLIPEEIIAQVIDRCDIVETIGGYIPMKRAGRNYKALCPFHHEKTPSFIISPDKQIYHCFGCGAGGNVVNFVMHQEHMEFPEALRMLANKVGVTVPEYTTASPQTLSERELFYKINELAAQFFHATLIATDTDESKQARKQLIDRGISLETVKKFKIGFARERWDALLTFLKSKNINIRNMEKAGLVVAKESGEGFYDRFRNRIMFPIYDVRGRCVAFGARAMVEGVAKYINSPETLIYTKSNHLYGLHGARDAIRELDYAIVVEGYLDCLTPFQAGTRNIVASLGTALTVEQIRLLRRYTKNVVMLFDSDTAGASATMRSLDVLIEEGMQVKVATLSAGEDPDSFVRAHGIDALNERIGESQPLFDYKLNSLLGKYSHKTVEGKAKISAQMLPTIKKFQNAVIKFEYIKQLGERLGISQEALLVELQKIPENAPVPEYQAPQQKPATEKKIRAVEWKLAHLLIEDQESIAVVKESVPVTDFHNEEMRRIVERIYMLSENGQPINISELITYFDDPEIARLISKLSTIREPLGSDVEKVREDLINRIHTDRNKTVREYLLRQIKEAEHSGDHDTLQILMKKFNQSIRGNG